MDMYGKPVVYVDIETSGGNFNTSSIIEIAAIRVEEGRIVQEYHSLVNPGRPLPYWITQLTGLTDNDLVQAPYFEDIAYQLSQILEGAIFVAHNVRFDYSYVKRQLEQHGYAFRPQLLCTVRLSRALYSEHKGHSLEKIIHRHNLDFKNRHRAYDDTAAIKQFAELAYQEKGAEQFSLAVAKQLKTQSMPPNIDLSHVEKLQNTPGVYIFKDEAGRPLYVGKSVKLRSRVLSHFTQALTDSKEMKIVQGAHSVETIEASNELEALLVESELVKKLKPILNRKLRRVTNYYALTKVINEDGYATLNSEIKNLTPEDDFTNIMGLYSSKSRLKSAVETKVKTFDLCPKLAGLEKTKGACFWRQLGKCRGACVGKEVPAVYNARLDLAMSQSKLENWPFDSAIALSTGQGDSLVLNNWVVTGYLKTQKGKQVLNKIEPIFSLDSYRILRSYISQHAQSISIQPFAG